VNSIFQRSNPAIEKLFAPAGSPKKVMCTPIDYAKRQHTALVCNGNGAQLRGPFHIHNNPAGVAFMEEVVAGLCRKHAIRRKHVFFGGEDCSAIAFTFIHALLQEGYLGIGLNARDAAPVAHERQRAPSEGPVCGAEGSGAALRSAFSFFPLAAVAFL
jgi:hypothetical protein